MYQLGCYEHQCRSTLAKLVAKFDRDDFIRNVEMIVGSMYEQVRVLKSSKIDDFEDVEEYKQTVCCTISLIMGAKKELHSLMYESFESLLKDPTAKPTATLSAYGPSVYGAELILFQLRL